MYIPRNKSTLLKLHCKDVEATANFLRLLDLNPIGDTIFSDGQNRLVLIPKQTIVEDEIILNNTKGEGKDAKDDVLITMVFPQLPPDYPQDLKEKMVHCFEMHSDIVFQRDRVRIEVNFEEYLEMMNVPILKPPGMCSLLSEIGICVSDIENTLVAWEEAHFLLHADWQQNDRQKIIGWKQHSLAPALGIYDRASCTHVFDEPALIFYAPDMNQRISELAETYKIPWIETITEQGSTRPDHAIAGSPDGLLFFLFRR